MRKEEVFKEVGDLGWEKSEKHVSHDDLTIKALYLNKQRKILFGLYEINDREIHFIQVGSELELVEMKDFFLF